MEVGCQLKFVPFESVVASSFWHKLCQLKLNVDKLDEKERSIWGYYLIPDICSLFVDCTSFNKEYECKLNTSKHTFIENLCINDNNTSTPLLVSLGTLINLNSLDSFKTYDKSKLLEKCGTIIKKDIFDGEALKNPELLSRFILLTFADLKTYEFFYWFAFVAPFDVSATIIEAPRKLQELYSVKEVSSLLKSHSSLPQKHHAMFGVHAINGGLICITLEEYVNLRNNGNEGLLLCFLDPSTEVEYPGWPLRNLLSLIAHNCDSTLNNKIEILCLRIGAAFKRSFIFSVKIKDKFTGDQWVGWEKNQRGKFGPRHLNLRNDMDPARLAESSADLNLKLMKWRLVPDLNLEVLQAQKCLILGAGTLGCSVARCLMAWGIRQMTFVDCGVLSLSNPVRQSLYNHEDCDFTSGPKYKAKVAAEAVRKILPSMATLGIVLEIPMPGHTTSDMNNANELHKLIESHDIIFLLTDSRESRWLPTLIATSLKKIAITAALGFDTYLVMRHGIEDSSGFKLGCYFCNDITAPGNSKIDRTLDQQCTVTRPGVSHIAGSLAVELAVSVLQHISGGAANAQDESMLGSLPHSIRGFLSYFNQVTPSTPSFSQCTACSQKVIREYIENRETFLEKVFESNVYLEELTGLSELHNFTEDMQAWEVNSEEEDDVPVDLEQLQID